MGWFGASIKRKEDADLLTGRSRYVDDIDVPGMLHAAVLRSPHARAAIRGIDKRAVLHAMPARRASAPSRDRRSRQHAHSLDRELALRPW